MTIDMAATMPGVKSAVTGQEQIGHKKTRSGEREGSEQVLYIHEAIKARTEEKPYITRESWGYITSVWCSTTIKIMPTNTPDCCTLESVASNGPRRGWQPKEEDLIAKDWIVVT